MKKEPKPITLLPIHCWDVIAYMRQHNQVAHDKHCSDIRALRIFQQKFDWRVDITALLQRTYEAIVLTDSQTVIQWVDEGFRDLTGYTSEDALGKTPRFLQGRNTSPASRAHLREHIQRAEAVESKVLNYQKNGAPYRCKLCIFPLHDKKGKLQHFLALENSL